MYHANCKMGEMQWSEPFKIAKRKADMVFFSRLSSLLNTIFWCYITKRRRWPCAAQMMVGLNFWSPPSTPSQVEIGVNGKLALVKDAGNHVHLLWGQSVMLRR